MDLGNNCSECNIDDMGEWLDSNSGDPGYKSLNDNKTEQKM